MLRFWPGKIKDKSYFYTPGKHITYARSAQIKQNINDLKGPDMLISRLDADTDHKKLFFNSKKIQKKHTILRLEKLEFRPFLPH